MKPRISKLLARNLSNLYVVGGAVRDILLGKTPSEFDLITTSTLNCIPRKVFAPSKDGKTVGVFIDGVKYDVTRYENLKEELRRRDFTINSMAVPVAKDGLLKTEEIVDPFNGMKDLKCGVLRSADVNNLFSDPVRVVRGLRFVSQTGFDVEERTLQAMAEAIKYVRNCAKERIYPPLEKFIFGSHLEKAFLIAKRIRVEKYLFLPLENMDKVWRLRAECRWPAVFFKAGKFEEFVNFVSPPRRVTNKIRKFVRLLSELESDGCEWTVEVKKEEINCFLELAEKFRLPTEKIKIYKCTTLRLSPSELENMGLKGKEIKIFLSRIWKAILNGEVKNEKEQLLRLVEKLIKSQKK